jgi:hypothetical protein
MDLLSREFCVSVTSVTDMLWMRSSRTLCVFLRDKTCTRLDPAGCCSIFDYPGRLLFMAKLEPHSTGIPELDDTCCTCERHLPPMLSTHLSNWTPNHQYHGQDHQYRPTYAPSPLATCQHSQRTPHTQHLQHKVDELRSLDPQPMEWTLWICKDNLTDISSCSSAAGLYTVVSIPA